MEGFLEEADLNLVKMVSLAGESVEKGRECEEAAHGPEQWGTQEEVGTWLSLPLILSPLHCRHSRGKARHHSSPRFISASVKWGIGRASLQAHS